MTNAAVHAGLDTEFGAVMRELVATVAGARGAVLSDRDGHPIDYALDATAIDELDLHIAGAQCAGALVAAAQFAVRRQIGGASLLIEAERGTIMGAVVDPNDEVVLVLVLRRHAHLGAALRRFARSHALLAALLA